MIDLEAIKREYDNAYNSFEVARFALNHTEALIDELESLRSQLAAANEAKEKAERERDAITAILETILVEVEPIRYEICRRIDDQVREAQEAAANSRRDREPWVFSAELRRTLERPYEGFEAAIRAGNELLDSAAIRKAAGLEET